MRIAFFGTPVFAVSSLDRLIASEHEVVCVVTQPDRPKGRGRHLAAPPVKERALAAGLPVLQPDRLKDDGFLGELRAFGPDLGVVAAYGRLLPQALLDLPRFGMVNVHASLLPRWRGAAPVQRAIMAGDATTGVTIMRVVKALDAGPMLARAASAIGPDDSGADVEARLAVQGARLLLEVVDRMAAGPVHLEPQNDADASYAPKITRADSPIDWRQSARRIHDQVRALDPWPLASTWVDGSRILLRRTQVDDGAATRPPGTVEVASGDDLIVATGDGRLRLIEVQPEGRATMSVRAYLNGHRLAPGAICTTPAP